MFRLTDNAWLKLKYGLLFPAISSLPRQLAYRLANQYGKWEYARDVEIAPQIANQMKRALPGHPEDLYTQWTRHFYILTQREILDTWYYPKLQSAEGVGRWIEVLNFAQVLAAKRQGRPMIFTGAHYGRFWMLGVVTGAYGIATGALARDGEERNIWGLPDAEFNYRKLKLSRLRRCYRGDFLMPGAGNLRPLLKALQRNPIAILMDVPYNKQSPGLVGVPFFGRLGYFPDGIYRIARKAGALIQPFVMEEEAGRLVLRFLPPHEPAERSSEEVLAALAGDLEQRIRANPGQWWQWRALPMFWGEV